MSTTSIKPNNVFNLSDLRSFAKKVVEEKPFSTILKGDFLRLYEGLRIARNAGFSALVRDGLLLLAVLSSVDEKGKQARVFIRFTDANGGLKEVDVCDYVALETVQPNFLKAPVNLRSVQPMPEKLDDDEYLMQK